MDDAQAHPDATLVDVDENALRPAFGDRLPPELWVMIWENLPFTDCMTVCAVCRQWNALAMATEYLWTELAVASPPFEGAGRADDGPDWEDQEYTGDVLSDADMRASYVALVPGILPGSITNIDVLTGVLSRTRFLGLSFYVILYGTVAQTYLEKLVYLLHAHKRRIVELHCFFVRPWLASTLLFSLQPLESIRSLQLHSPYDTEYCDEFDYNPRHYDNGWNIHEIADIVDDHPTTFRMLESFSSSATFSWYTTPPALPRLTVLCLEATDYEEIETALAVCPRLENLRVHLTFHTPEPLDPEISQAALATASRLRTVRLTQVHSSHQLWLRRVFSSATRETFSLSYAHAYMVDSQCPNMVDEIARPTQIVATFTPIRMCIECADDTPRRRQQRSLSIPIDSVDYARNLLRYMPTANVRFIRCSWLLWDPISTLKSLQSLEVLELLVDDDPHVLSTDALPELSSHRMMADVTNMLATAGPYVLVLPAFHTLRICKSGTGWTGYAAQKDLRVQLTRLCDVLAHLPTPSRLEVKDRFRFLCSSIL